MAYNISERSVLEKYFLSLSNARLHPFIDHSLTLMCKRIVIDISAFDDYITEKHTEDAGNLSLAEIVHKHYGDEALALIDELL